MLFGQVGFERGLHILQFQFGEGGQQRADHHHVQQAAVAGLFGDLVAGHEDGGDVGPLGGVAIELSWKVRSIV